MKYLSSLYLLITLIGVMVSFGYYNSVLAYQLPASSFISYKQYKTLQKDISTYDNINQAEIDKVKYLIKDKTCYTQKYGDKLAVSPLCIINKKIPTLPRKQSVDLLWDHIEAFDTFYDLERQYFEYDTANPIFDQNTQVYTNAYDRTPTNTYLLLGLAYENIMIIVPDIVRAKYSSENYSWYVVRKDLSNQGGCGLKNYNVAYKSLNNLILPSHKDFTINNHISYLPGYCHNGGKTEPFYGGVCGASTQLFRISLLHPKITVTERENHSRRRVYYYAEYIYGDDAGIYGDFKRFTIKNTDDDPILIKTKVSEDKKWDYLVAISPKKYATKSTITKKQTGKLSANVKKEVVNKHSNRIISTQSFPSTYKKKHYGMN